MSSTTNPVRSHGQDIQPLNPNEALQQSIQGRSSVDQIINPPESVVQTIIVLPSSVPSRFRSIYAPSHNASVHPPFRTPPLVNTPVYKSPYGPPLVNIPIYKSPYGPPLQPHDSDLQPGPQVEQDQQDYRTGGEVNHRVSEQPDRDIGESSRASEGQDDNMSNQGIDLTADVAPASTGISWHQPHPIFAIVLVGSEETPFGIQKDLLCSKSPYYREEFAKMNAVNALENIVRLPDTETDTFGCFQNFIYTGAVYDKANGISIPDYTKLMGVWKLATKLKMPNLRLAVLDVMAERRQETNCIPGPALLVQAWEQTEDGSGLRKMLIGWVAEHMRSEPTSRNDFVKALPKEILGELVLAMSDMGSLPIHHAPISYVQQNYGQPAAPLANGVNGANGVSGVNGVNNMNGVNGSNQNNDIYLSPYININNDPPRPAVKRQRKSEVAFGGDDTYEVKPLIKKPSRRSEPAARKNRRVSQAQVIPLSADKELNFCGDLISRMLSGPGFWTRLVGPFRNPVDPVADNVPNYFAVVKNPMDLSTIKSKMVKGEYNSGAEFEADMRLIFQNCYEYWTENDGIFKSCEQLEKYFNEKWNERHRWSGPTIKAEVID